jgi:hypothetical protein
MKKPRPAAPKVTARDVAQARAFVEKHGIVLQSGRGPVPSFAAFVAGEPIRGSWWAHPAAHRIFALAEAVTESGDVLVCRLVEGKVTYVHRRLWPALVKLASRFDRERLAKAWSEHTPSGAHVAKRLAYPRWVPPEIRAAAARLTREQAEADLRAVLAG